MEGEVSAMSLTGPERETVITLSDADHTATIHTHQRRIITKLLNNPAAKKIERPDLRGIGRQSSRSPPT